MRVLRLRTVQHDAHGGGGRNHHVTIDAGLSNHRFQLHSGREDDFGLVGAVIDQEASLAQCLHERALDSADSQLTADEIAHVRLDVDRSGRKGDASTLDALPRLANQLHQRVAAEGLAELVAELDWCGDRVEHHGVAIRIRDDGSFRAITLVELDRIAPGRERRADDTVFGEDLCRLDREAVLEVAGEGAESAEIRGELVARVLQPLLGLGPLEKRIHDLEAGHAEPCVGVDLLPLPMGEEREILLQAGVCLGEPVVAVVVIPGDENRLADTLLHRGDCRCDADAASSDGPLNESTELIVVSRHSILIDLRVA
ncbi:MAG: hypothetical protein RIQ56_592 [Candidatus Parcubacteria bacterium]